MQRNGSLNHISEKSLTTRTGNHVERVGSISIEHCKVFEIVSSLDHKDDVDANNQVERKKERLVVLPIACCKGVGKLLLEGLVPSFSSRRFGRY